MSRFSTHIRQNVVGYVAVFLALTMGTAYATHPGGKGTISTADIKKRAVTTPKLKRQAVKAGKLAGGAVNEAKILDLAVTTPKLADGAASAEKLATAAVTNPKLATGAVTAGKIGDGAVTTAKFNSFAEAPQARNGGSWGARSFLANGSSATLIVAQGVEVEAVCAPNGTPSTSRIVFRNTSAQTRYVRGTVVSPAMNGESGVATQVVAMRWFLAPNQVGTPFVNASNALGFYDILIGSGPVTYVEANVGPVTNGCEAGVVAVPGKP